MLYSYTEWSLAFTEKYKKKKNRKNYGKKFYLFDGNIIQKPKTARKSY